MSDVLEDRLRRTFDAVAATSDEPVVAVAEPPRSRRPIALVAASLLVVLGLAATMFAVRTDDDPAPAADLPAWYQAIAPALPDGFDHLAVTQSHELFVQFRAVDPSSPLALSLTVTRGAMPPDPSGAITLAEAQAGPWTDPSEDLNISLPDGRQIGVYCSTPTLTGTETPCPSFGEQEVTADEIRDLALALVALDAGVLPDPNDQLAHVAPALLNAAARQVIDQPLIHQFEAPHYADSAAAYGLDPDGAPSILLTAVVGVSPTMLVDTQTAERDGSTFAWRSMPDGSIWTVLTAPTVDADVGTQILAAGATLTTERANTTLPDWYWWLSPALPPGFVHITVAESDGERVMFQLVDPASPGLMGLVVSRAAVEPNPDGTMTLAELEAGSPPDLAVRLPDDREVWVLCAVSTVVDAAPCDELPEPVAADELRAFALAAARDLPVEALPPADPELELSSEVPPFDDAARSLTDVDLDNAESSARWGYAQYVAAGSIDAAILEVRYVRDLVPPLPDPAGAPQTWEIDGATITTKTTVDGTFVIATTRAPLDGDAGRRILDAIP